MHTSKLRAEILFMRIKSTSVSIVSRHGYKFNGFHVMIVFTSSEIVCNVKKDF